MECLELERKLRECYGLEEVIVVPPDPSGDESTMTVKKAVALEGARYVQRIIRPEDILGIAWGARCMSLFNISTHASAPRPHSSLFTAASAAAAASLK